MMNACVYVYVLVLLMLLLLTVSITEVCHAHWINE